uniref:Uncharacterized protein n=1 Tax=Heterorhabditis bacteriophora TaxID=37862 RepID=A0A1I7X5D1_HETBA
MAERIAGTFVSSNEHGPRHSVGELAHHTIWYKIPSSNQLPRQFCSNVFSVFITTKANSWWVQINPT